MGQRKPGYWIGNTPGPPNFAGFRQSVGGKQSFGKDEMKGEGGAWRFPKIGFYRSSIEGSL
ncbi:MAG: hypothetical protein Fur0022_06100 [Anaerolineales bacterium]